MHIVHCEIALCLSIGIVLLSEVSVTTAKKPMGRPNFLQNMHVTDWGDYSTCVAPPTGSCADYAITESDVLESLSGFTTHVNGCTNCRRFKTQAVKYYGDWWASNVGTDIEVDADFCTTGAGVSQTPQEKSYHGVSFSMASDDSYRLLARSIPTNDVENYCSAAGGRTPPFIGTDFDTDYTQTFSFQPSAMSRETISNSVGWAVDGVIILSPYTGAGTIAPYDETLDTCNGHPAGGRYHYHGFSPCLHEESGTQIGHNITHSKIYGWAYDGFPIYGPYGYEDGNDIGSDVMKVTGGYACSVNGSPCTDDSEKATPDNWTFDSANGLLDECNGRWTKTPEFPNGMYVYVLNIQDNGKPDFPGVPYCTHGKATNSTDS